MEYILLLLQLLETAVLVYLGGSSLYMLVFAIIGSVFKAKPSNQVIGEKFQVIIPSYKEDAVIKKTAVKALDQNYPSELFDVVVIADQLKEETITYLRKKGVLVHEVAFKKSTKSKALNHLLKNTTSKYNLALILDADNIMEPNFLLKIAARYREGNRVIQGRRVAKEITTSTSQLDAISEAINYTIYNKGHQLAGLSARIVGSGVAIDYKLYAQVMPTIDAVGGFDKEMELKFTQQNVFVDYLHDALVFDEKVPSTEVFGKQRKRWISAQYHYLGIFWKPALRDLSTKGNFDLLNKTFQMALPPRLLLPVALVFFFLLSIIFNSQLSVIWFFALVTNVLANTIALPRRFYNTELIEAAKTLPSLILKTLQAVTQLKGANKKFIHTPHSS